MRPLTWQLQVLLIPWAQLATMHIDCLTKNLVSIPCHKVVTAEDVSILLCFLEMIPTGSTADHLTTVYKTVRSRIMLYTVLRFWPPGHVTYFQGNSRGHRAFYCYHWSVTHWRFIHFKPFTLAFTASWQCRSLKRWLNNGNKDVLLELQCLCHACQPSVDSLVP